MQEIKVKLDVFEGPLDLLLHLIKTLEIDIYDIPIAQVTDQYMNFIHAMKTSQLEVAGDYLVMAATLMSIKSQMLLPKQEIEDDDDNYEEDPRESLVAQLLEYRKYKYAADQLSEKAEERRHFFTKEPMDMDEYKDEDTSLEANQFNTIDLYLAFQSMLEKKKKRQVLKTTIAADETSIDEKIHTIETQLYKRENAHQGCSLDSFMDNFETSEIVVTFIALLELVKSQKVHVSQSENYKDILLYPTYEDEGGHSNE
ncbi:segregation/condensation protein A [Tetragenococcus solitarius]|uniref:Segregation and condensation protein A n=1 Tax=Tetragenococcus solitarius TaxID=71453 RepID=A0ABN3YAC5_9ENTE|nr:segregation/condensation protein A [Tetragenococcus solitarius]